MLVTGKRPTLNAQRGTSFQPVRCQSGLDHRQDANATLLRVQRSTLDVQRSTSDQSATGNPKSKMRCQGGELNSRPTPKAFVSKSRGSVLDVSLTCASRLPLPEGED